MLLKIPSSALTNMDEQDLSIQNFNWVLTYFKIFFYMCLCHINILLYCKTIASSVLSAGSVVPKYKLTAGVKSFCFSEYDVHVKCHSHTYINMFDLFLLILFFFPSISIFFVSFFHVLHWQCNVQYSNFLSTVAI